ncbi:hypothetical protein H072_6581 [Dactylellina haptotyla CBS 200.50]|uniref:GST C-terminal domain-containing protein n=1 Tax=Dactylellina haptotyla (strain CBS 200.50) TaxID=1284197 RepID=S8BJV5_DACHA|nr:hypothetical protein H072_6581 [Dactylellina haptotyla CBS 200.50]
MAKVQQHNYWPHSSPPGIPTVYCLSSSGAIRTLWALEELVANGKLNNYILKNYKRGKHAKAPEEMREGFRLGRSPILSVSPASAPKQPPIPFVESRLINQFLAIHYSNGLWDQPTPEDEARNVFFQEFSGTTFSTLTSLVLTMDLVPQATPWPFKPLIMAIFYPIVNIMKRHLEEPLQFLEDSLSEAQPWFSGPKLGLADFHMIFTFDTCVARGYFDAAKYPKLARWYDNISKMPTYQAAVRKMGSYDMKTFDSF